MSHTPTPWRVNGSELNTAIWIESGIGKRVATIRPSDHDADIAAFIVRACNAWNDPDALLARLHELSEADEARRYTRTPQQEQELEVMRSRGEI